MARNTNVHFDEWYDDLNGQLGDYNILDKNTPVEVQNEVHNSLHLRTLVLEYGVYYTYRKIGAMNQKMTKQREVNAAWQLEPIEINLYMLRNELQEMRKLIVNTGIYENGWVDD